MRIRRLKILGVATVLSGIAALAGAVLYLLPREQAPSLNRTADFVLLNEAVAFARAHPPLGNALGVPDREDENESLRLIAIDERSLRDPRDRTAPGLGQFPWPRSLYGTLLTKLHRAGAGVVTFDVAFFEPSADPRQDAAFAAGMRAQRTVLGESLNITSGGVLGVQRPPPALASAAGAIGFTSVDTVGGWLVGQPLTIAAGGTSYPSLAAATASAFLGVPVRTADAWSARLGGTPVPLDGERLMLMLPFTTQETVTPSGALSQTAPFFQSLSFADALKLDDASLKTFAGGKIVVIGATATALGDYVATPGGRAPGVFGNLRMIDQLVRHRFIARVPPALDLALIVLLPLLIGFVVTQLRPLFGVAIALGAVAGYAVLAVAVYGATLHWLNLVHVATATLFAALFVALYRTITEGADKRVIREMFGKHVSPALVDEMLARDDPMQSLALAGKRVRVTIFYSDIRGFTSMSETMSPEEIYAALNEYFEEMCKLVFEHGGYVDKFIGDCVMAVFSAPNPRPNDAHEAVLSAWRQQQRILEMMAVWAAAGRKIFTVGMGLNTGEVVMGNLGSRDRLNYTVIGDNVNTAARLYNVAKGGQIIISESTYEDVKDHFIVNELTPVFVKGKVLALRNFEVVGLLKPGEANPSRLLDPANLPAPSTAEAH
ncbi:MAG TPA: adenylate/guanylate cyclase domain-containing protein [Candidatus Elarobacter sp.]|jgi:adenylate cyclase